jgi:acyl carrier protein
MDRISSDLEQVFRRVFDDDDIVIADSTTATDIEGWDSIGHMNLIVAIEKQFGLRFAAREIASMRGDGQNVGNLVQLITAKVAQGPGDGAGPTTPARRA